MKIWYVTHGDMEYMCSLLSLSGASKIATFRSGLYIINFQFMKFYDFSRAKDGNRQTGWIKLPHTEEKVRAKIIFK